MKTYVVYHKSCYDGFCAAWVASKSLPADTEFIPASYGDPVPDFEPGSEIYILDFSYPRDVLIGINFLSKKTVVLDHHKTAQANCEGLDFCIFDMEKSGAGLTWDYFHPGEPRPSLVDYVEDRDLWRFAFPESRAVFEWYASYPMDFEFWDELSTRIELDPIGVFTEGDAILRHVRQKVEQACKQAVMVELGGYEVPAVNVPYTMGSDVGERLLELYPDAPFSGYWFVKSSGEQQWGLRSRKGAGFFDVSEVAKQYGGGGHATASGFIMGRVTR